MTDKIVEATKELEKNRKEQGENQTRTGLRKRVHKVINAYTYSPTSPYQTGIVIQEKTDRSEKYHIVNGSGVHMVKVKLPRGQNKEEANRMVMLDTKFSGQKYNDYLKVAKEVEVLKDVLALHEKMTIKQVMNNNGLKHKTSAKEKEYIKTLRDRISNYMELENYEDKYILNVQEFGNNDYTLKILVDQLLEMSTKMEDKCGAMIDDLYEKYKDDEDKENLDEDNKLSHLKFERETEEELQRIAEGK